MLSGAHGAGRVILGGKQRLCNTSSQNHTLGLRERESITWWTEKGKGGQCVSEWGPKPELQIERQVAESF